MDLLAVNYQTHNNTVCVGDIVYFYGYDTVK